MDLKYKTNEMGDPQGKPKVYFACHPDDFAGAFPLLSDDILEISDCAVWYDPDPSRMPGSGRPEAIAMTFPASLALKIARRVAAVIFFCELYSVPSISSTSAL